MTRTNQSSLKNALHILKSFSADNPELSLDEIVERVAVSKSTACRLIQTLQSEGFMTQHTRSNTYALGVSILSLSNMMSDQFYGLKEMTGFLKKLTHITGESSHIAVLQGNEVVYLKKEDNQHRVQLRSHIGKRNPAHCTASGLALLGYLSNQELVALYDNGFETETSYSISTIDQLTERLEAGRKQGYFTSDREMVETVLSIGAPIFNKNGEVIASVSIAGPRKRLLSQFKKNTDEVVETSHYITRFIQQL